MICSKCKFKLKDEDNICPKCGKLVKEECPRCSTATLDKTCPKCKLNLVKKCPKCSQTNHIMQDVCIRCKNVLKTHEHLTLFASVSIEIQNIEIVPKKDELKKILQGIGLYLKDEAKAKNIGFKHLKKNIFVLKFFNSETLKESCIHSIKYAFEIVRFLESLNESISRRYKKKFKIRVGLSLLNKFDRRNLSRVEQAININEEIYIIGNSYIVKHINDAKIEHLISLPENNRINKIYKIMPFEEEKEEIKQVPASILYDLDVEGEPKVKLELEKYTQENIEQVGFEPKLYTILSEHNEYNFINIETDIRQNKFPLIDFYKMPFELRKTKFCKLKCSKNDLFTPFSFIKNVIFSFYTCSLINLQDADFLKVMGLKELYRLVNMDLQVNTNLDEMKFRIFDEFKLFLNNIAKKNNVVFVVENFELIDKSSLECLNDIVEKNCVSNEIKFVLLTENSNNFINKEIPVILDKSYFLNITLKKSEYESMAYIMKKMGVNLRDSHLFQKVFKNSKGSFSYLMHSISYLESINQIDVSDGKISIIEDNLMALPFSIEEIIQKRLDALAKRKDLYKFFIQLVFISDSFKFEDIKAKFGIDSAKYINTLCEKRFLTEILSTGVVVINNYNTVYEYISRILDEKDIDFIKSEMYETLNLNQEHTKLQRVNFAALEDEKTLSRFFYDLAYACVALGDINSAHNCFEKFIEIVGRITKNIAEFNKVKLDIYKTIIMLAIDSNYDMACDYVEKSIDIINDKKALINYYFLMVQASFCAEKYKLTKEYIAKLFNCVPVEIFDIYSEKFDINFYNLKLIETKVYYFTGETKKAIELSDEVLQTLVALRNTNAYRTDNDFKNILDNSISEALAFKTISQLTHNDTGFSQTLGFLQAENSKVFSTSILQTIYEVYKNLSLKSFSNLEKIVLSAKGNLLEKNISALFYLFACTQMGQFDKALALAFKFKKQTVYTKQTKQFFELLIVAHHINIGLYNRAKELLENVIKIAKENQFNFVLYVSWVLLSRIEALKGNMKEAYEILNQSNVLMEEQQNVPKLFSIIFKRELSNILNNIQSEQEAKIPMQMALNQAIASDYDYLKIDAAIMIINILKKELHTQEDPIHRNQLEIELQNIYALAKDSLEKLDNPYLQNRFSKFLQLK